MLADRSHNYMNEPVGLRKLCKRECTIQGNSIENVLGIICEVKQGRGEWDTYLSGVIGEKRLLASDAPMVSS